METARKNRRRYRTDLQNRTRAYAVRAIRLFQYLNDCGERSASIIGRQYLRSATSIGANVAEAVYAESRGDFAHKYAIARKEAHESLYWLSLMLDAQILSTHRITPLIAETNELIAILTTIIILTRSKQ